MRKKMSILLGVIVVSISVCIFAKANTTESVSEQTYKDSVKQEDVNGYVEHVVNPDGTVSEKTVDEETAKRDVEKTMKNGQISGSSWVSYVKNPDGTYTSRLGVTYKYMKKVEYTGDTYWVLANKEDVKGEDVLTLLGASSDANYKAWGMEFVYYSHA